MDAPVAQEPAETPDVATHIVDQLIEERATGLRSLPPLWAVIKALAYPLLGYREAVAMADTVGPMSGPDAFDWTSGFLNLRNEIRGVENVPVDGPVVLIANHPGGIADGIAIWDAVAKHRPDLCYFANRDAIRVVPRVDSVVIPVEWREQERTMATARETLRAAAQAFRAGRCVGIFPAGAMSEWSWRRFSLVERPWQQTAVSMARKYNASIVPVGVRARLTWLYYALAQISSELKNMTVFYELLKKRNARYRLTFAEPVMPGDLPSDDAEASELLRRRCIELAKRSPPDGE